MEREGIGWRGRELEELDGEGGREREGIEWRGRKEKGGN